MAQGHQNVLRGLDGRRLLLILLQAPNHQEHVLTGYASLATGDLHLVRTGEPPFAVPSENVERSGFAPDVLPRLINTERYGSLMAQLCVGVDYCIPAVIERAPRDAVSVPGLLNGVAFGGAGEIFLMQALDPDQTPTLEPPFRPLRIAADEHRIFRRISDLVKAMGVDPESTVIAEFHPAGPANFLGLLVTRAGQVFQFRYDHTRVQEAEGRLSGWEELTDKWRAFPFHERVGEILRLLRG